MDAGEIKIWLSDFAETVCWNILVGCSFAEIDIEIVVSHHVGVDLCFNWLVSVAGTYRNTPVPSI